MDSTTALTGCIADLPRGCMVTLSTVGSEGHAELGEMVRNGRASIVKRVEARIAQAVTDGEIDASVNIRALARFVQAVQAGMSILARDGSGRVELEEMAEVAMSGWDARVESTR